ncbi:hypothetical protein [Microbacterium hominis]|uniref:Uncharacterized protein n=2 Tax=Microbacterium TaxID=33882 RepID=A0A7D4PUE9_9MICO|nr:hypothetical protein [Microbacterium hominis]QKJ19174.1 hypothetical protein HQM25_07185 [Microbacterium hominis]
MTIATPTERNTMTDATTEQAAAEPDTATDEALWAVLADGKPHALRELLDATPGLPAEEVRTLLSAYRRAGLVEYSYDERKARRAGARAERLYRATQ